jgi:hypothetical protein
MGHPYSMADHGLFVAGIIHTLAPHANLHLYEVLNPSGAGCIFNIFYGIERALVNLGEQNPLIINCSLVLGLQRENDLTTDFPFTSLDPKLRTTFLEHLNYPIQHIFDMLEKENVIVVAAAGNDAEADHRGNNHGRPAARFPAAYKSVLGVGAIQRLQGGAVKIASYSNLACDPGDEGYVTLGGEEGDPEGVRGAYISQLPQYNGPNPRPKRGVRANQVAYNQNDAGWAWWAGTSFAAPVVTGLIAKWWNIGSQNGISRAKSILDKFADAEPTPALEKVIVIHQEEGDPVC